MTDASSKITRCVNRSAFGGTVPHFHQMSRVPRNETNVPHLIIIVFVLPIILHFDLERYKVTNKARFILRTPTDAIYISRVAAITSGCLFCYAAGSVFIDRLRKTLRPTFQLSNFVG